MEALAILGQSFGGMVLLKSTLIVSLVFALSFLLRKASAASRHFLWTLCFIALLTLPLANYLSVVDSSWRIPVPVLSSAAEIVDAPAEAPLTAPAPSPNPSSPSSPPWNKTSVSAETAAPIGQMAWILGGSLLTVRLMAGLFSSYRTGRRAPAMLDDRWLELLEKTKEKIGIRHDVQLALAASSAMPITLGVFRPTILLPESSESYSEPRRSAVLLHELAHVRRRDCLTQLISQTACAVFWWHPLVWIGARQMRSLSERASDDLVIDAGTRPSEYAHDLLDMARGLNLRGTAAPLASVTMAHRSRLEERLLAILDDGMVRGSVRPRVALPSAVFGLGVLLSLGLAIPTAARAPQTEPETPQTEPETAAAPQEQETEEPERPERPEREEAQEQEPSETSRRAREALAEALDDPSASVREQALHALVRLQDERTIPYLEQALQIGDAEMREEAAWGLGQMRRKEASGSLARALSDEIDSVREQAAWALGMTRSKEAVAALGAALINDTSSNVREQSAWALGMIRDEAAADALVSALRDDDANLRAQAAWACGMIRNGDAVDGLVGALTDVDENVRSQAAWGLGMIRDGRAIQGLGRALGDESVDVREQAIWAVGMIRSPESFDVLITALSDSSADIRGQAAWALGMLGDSRAIDALSGALKDDDADVREQAAWAIGRLAKHGDNDVDLDDVDVDVDVDELELDDLDVEVDVNGGPKKERPDPRSPLRDALV